MARIRNRWEKARNLETRYSRALRAVAYQVGSIVSGLFGAGVKSIADPVAVAAVGNALERYSQLIKPWAEATAGRLIADLERQDGALWRKHTEMMGRALREELRNAPVGEVVRQRLAEQVRLITSLPLEASLRVHRLAIQGIQESARADEVYKEIMRTGEVTESRARTIARTETSRVASSLTEARARSVGSEGYIWRTSKDGDVRPSHKAMEGKLVRWDNPPSLDGMVGHAGCLPNCRCFPEPVIPEHLEA